VTFRWKSPLIVGVISWALMLGLLISHDHTQSPLSDAELKTSLHEEGTTSLQYAMNSVVEAQNRDQPTALAQGKSAPMRRESSLLSPQTGGAAVVEVIRKLPRDQAFETAKQKLESPDPLDLGTQLSLINYLTELGSQGSPAKEYALQALTSGKIDHLPSEDLTEQRDSPKEGQTSSQQYFMAMLNTYFVLSDDSNEAFDGMKQIYDDQKDGNNRQYLIQTFSERFPDQQANLKAFMMDRGLAQAPAPPPTQ
jgi:hypothetical protein